MQTKLLVTAGLAIFSIVNVRHAKAWSQPTPGEPQIVIQTKVFLTDPGTRQTNFAIKLSIGGFRQSGVAMLHCHGLDSENFVLADLRMHAVEIVAGKNVTCTKRFEIPETDFNRIVKWHVADAEQITPQGEWTIEHIRIRTIPHNESPDIGSLLFRIRAQYSGQTQSDRIPIQGLDQDGFEWCHFLIDKYDCEHGHSARKGHWKVSEQSVDIDSFVSVFRPLDFQKIPKLTTWQAIPSEGREANLYGIYPWTGNAP